MICSSIQQDTKSKLLKGRAGLKLKPSETLLIQMAAISEWLVFSPLQGETFPKDGMLMQLNN